MQRHRAVMSVPHKDAAQVQQVGEIFRVRFVDREAADRPLVLKAGAMNRQTRNARQSLVSVSQERGFIGMNAIESEAPDVGDRRAQRDRLHDRQRPRFELGRRLRPSGMRLENPIDHVPAAHERVHLREQLFAAIKHADASRPEKLVAGQSQEVDLGRHDIRRQMRHGLRPIDQDQSPDLMRPSREFFDRVNRPEHVGHPRHRDQLRLASEELIEPIEIESAISSQRQPAKRCPAFGTDELPRNDVRMMLHLRDEHFIAGLQELAAPGARHEVDRHRRPRGEDDLLAAVGSEELSH